MRLESKIAIVTGGASGIGLATAQLFSKEGAKVVIADYQSDAGLSAAQTIQTSGGNCIFVQVDVSDFEQVQLMVNTVLTAYHGVDILFNAAAVLAFGTALDTDIKTWARVMSINLFGTFYCCKAVLPHMIQRGGGSIINVSSSTGAHDAKGNTLAYVTSKGGVTLLTKAMAIDHAKAGVRVNALCPGPTDTPMLRSVLSPDQIQAFAETFPMGRMGRPEELANAALFLASDESSFVTGAMIPVDGGQTAEV